MNTTQEMANSEGKVNNKISDKNLQASNGEKIINNSKSNYEQEELQEYIDQIKKGD